MNKIKLLINKTTRKEFKFKILKIFIKYKSKKNGKNKREKKLSQ